MKIDYKAEVTLGHILYLITIIAGGVALFYSLQNGVNSNSQSIRVNSKSISELKEANLKSEQTLTVVIEKTESRLQTGINKLESNIDWLVRQKIEESKEK